MKKTKYLIYFKNEFERKCVLKFTREINANNKLPFLNVFINAAHDTFSTPVFTKNSNSRDCLIYGCDPPSRYKDGLIFHPSDIRQDRV